MKTKTQRVLKGPMAVKNVIMAAWPMNVCINYPSISMVRECLTYSGHRCRCSPHTICRDIAPRLGKSRCLVPTNNHTDSSGTNSSGQRRCEKAINLVFERSYFDDRKILTKVDSRTHESEQYKDVWNIRIVSLTISKNVIQDNKAW